MQLNQEIEKVKATQLAGYGRGGQTQENIQLNLGALAALDAADLSANGECSNKCGGMGKLFQYTLIQSSYNLHGINVFTPTENCSDPENGGAKAWTSGTTGTALNGSQQVQLGITITDLLELYLLGSNN